MFLVSCSNSPEIEGAVEKTINQLIETIQKNGNQIEPVSARSILTRKDIELFGCSITICRIINGPKWHVVQVPRCWNWRNLDWSRWSNFNFR